MIMSTEKEKTLKLRSKIICSENNLNHAGELHKKYLASFEI